VIILVGNKSDLVDERDITLEDAQKLANTHGITYMEVSAKDLEPIQKLFTEMAKQIDKVYGSTIRKRQSTIQVGVLSPKRFCC
jgi:GTPase SAR1 family protein